MRRVAAWLLLLLLLGSAAGCGTKDAALQEIRDRGVLRVGVKVDVPAFGYLNPSTGELEGLEIDLAREIAGELLGDREAVELTGVTAQTRGPMLDNGELDIVIATFTVTEERKKSFAFTDPYFHDEIGFLVTKDAGLGDMMDMDGKTIGVAQFGTAHNALTEEAESLGIHPECVTFASYPEISAALLAGKVDAFAADKSILAGYLDDDTVIPDYGFAAQDYGIASKLDNRQLADYLQNFIRTITEDGRLGEILRRWGQKSSGAS